MQSLEIDLIAPDRYERTGVPHDELRWLREHDPVHWHEDLASPRGGFWAVTTHADVVTVSRDSQLFSSYRRGALFEEWNDDDLALQRQMMLNMDPPQHTRQRGFVNRGFTPRMVRQLEGHVREMCASLIAEVAPRGEADFVHDIAAPLPLWVICELLGAPEEDREMLYELSNRLIGFDDPELSTSVEDGALAAAEIYAYASAMAEERLARPTADIASQLLQPDAEGNLLTSDEFNLFVLLLVIAGNETTRTAASGGMQAMFEHPEQWRRLLSDRSLVPTAVDEMVRWVSPLNLFRRTATAATQLGGKEILEDDKVVVFYASANRDELVFPDPYRFDVGRHPNPHVGFGGGGPHFCLGSHLAKLNLRVLFEALLDAMPDIEPAGEPRRLRSNFINGIKELPVRFSPASALRSR